ncbi:MAG: hypothetical protein ISS70_23965 [Phycisphaerae bacterium]|nr:hypothetical protein [Phycisphaerae bacterium]
MRKTDFVNKFSLRHTRYDLSAIIRSSSGSGGQAARRNAKSGGRSSDQSFGATSSTMVIHFFFAAWGRSENLRKDRLSHDSLIFVLLLLGAKATDVAWLHGLATVEGRKGIGYFAVKEI